MDLTKLHLHWRASKHKDKTYRSYSLARAYRENGKNRKEIIVKLGKLSDEEADTWRNLLKTIKKPHVFMTTCEDIAVTDHFAYLDVAVANSIWDFWNFDMIFRNNGKRDVSIANITRILTLNRCSNPATKSQVPEWFAGTALPWMIDIDSDSVNASRIFRELDAIEEHKEAICKHLFEQISLKYSKESMSSVFYDLSSTTFTGARCELMKWGHCKEGYKNHVVLAIVVNQDGLPFYWEVLPGGTADANTIDWLMRRLKDRFKSNNTTLVFDRGMVSDDNLELIENKKIKYVSAMDKSQLEGITKLDFNKFLHLDQKNIDKQVSSLPNFSKLDDNTFYQEIKLEGKRRYILCFNPQLFKDQRKARKQAIENFQTFTENLNSELLEAKGSRQQTATLKKFKKVITKFKLTSFIDINLEEKYVVSKNKNDEVQKIRTYSGTVHIDNNNKLSAGRLDGFWLLVTNQTEKKEGIYTVSARNAIAPYRDKVVIESAFRDIKSFVEIAPVHVWTNTHVKAHYTICVLSYLINRTLTLQLHKKTGDLTKDIVSHEKLYAELSGCMIDRIKIDNAGISTYNMTRPNERQKELLKRVNMDRLISQEAIKKIKTAV
jgi:transposase